MSASLRQPPEVTHLRDRVAELEERVRQMSAPPAVDMRMPDGLRLTRTPLALLGALYRRPMVSRDAAVAIINAVNGGRMSSHKSLDTHICKLRRVLKPYGVQIGTRWGEGYVMPAESRAIVAGWCA